MNECGPSGPSSHLGVTIWDPHQLGINDPQSNCPSSYLKLKRTVMTDFCDAARWTGAALPKCSTLFSGENETLISCGGASTLSLDWRAQKVPAATGT